MNKTRLKNIFLLFVLTFAVKVYADDGHEQTFDINQQHLSRNYNSRIQQIVLHYTVGHFLGSLETLDGDTNKQVSSHYLINDAPNDKYPDYIYQLVPDMQRSWHAGISHWYHDTDLITHRLALKSPI